MSRLTELPFVQAEREYDVQGNLCVRPASVLRHHELRTCLVCSRPSNMRLLLATSYNIATLFRTFPIGEGLTRLLRKWFINHSGSPHIPVAVRSIYAFHVYVALMFWKERSSSMLLCLTSGESLVHLGLAQSDWAKGGNKEYFQSVGVGFNRCQQFPHSLRNL